MTSASKHIHAVSRYNRRRLDKTLPSAPTGRSQSRDSKCVLEILRKFSQLRIIIGRTSISIAKLARTIRVASKVPSRRPIANSHTIATYIGALYCEFPLILNTGSSRDRICRLIPARERELDCRIGGEFLTAGLSARVSSAKRSLPFRIERRFPRLKQSDIPKRRAPSTEGYVGETKCASLLRRERLGIRVYISHANELAESADNTSRRAVTALQRRFCGFRPLLRLIRAKFAGANSASCRVYSRHVPFASLFLPFA